MAVTQLLKYAGEITGSGVLDDTRRTQLMLYINRACRELYESGDLPGSLWERVFAVEADSQLITLPWYVGSLRGVRRATYSNKVQLVDMRPRYHYRPWRQPTLQWRVIGRTPLIRSLTQASQLQVTVLAAQTETFTVTIVGQTTTASRAQETLTFEPGDLVKTTSMQWTQAQPTGIFAIRKSARTTADVLIKQSVDGVTVAEIPNHLTSADNALLQVHDGSYTLTYTSGEGAEILFKWPFVELAEDTDQFLSTDTFDQCVIWKMREHWHSTREGETEPVIAAAAASKCSQLLRELCNNQESAIEKTVMFEENPYELAMLGASRFQRYAQIQ